MNKKLLASRLKEIRRNYKSGEYTQDTFAEYLGIPIATYKSLEIGRAVFSIEKIDVLKEKVGVNPNWLLYGEGEMFLEDDEKNLNSIPYYEDIKASAGFGAINGDVAEPEFFLLPPKFLQNCNRKTTEAINVSGDSMNPSLKDGDIMFIDKSDTEIRNGEVYIVRVDDEVYVKRLFKVPGKILARSDNAGFPEFTLDGNFAVLGRVIYKMERV